MNRQSERVAYAEIWKRGLAFLIDLIVIFAIGAVVVYFTNILLGLPIEYVSIFQNKYPIKMNDFVKTHAVKLMVLYLFIKLTLIFFFFSWFESSAWQATPGKYTCGLVVVDLEGRRISFRRAAIRTVGKFLSSNLLLLGYALAFFNVEKRMLHDFLAKTLVIKKNGETITSVASSEERHRLV